MLWCLVCSPFRVMCACGETDSCGAPGRLCHCDANDLVWRSDEGYITHRPDLPVKAFCAGDTGEQTGRIARQAMPIYLFIYSFIHSFIRSFILCVTLELCRRRHHSFTFPYFLQHNVCFLPPTQKHQALTQVVDDHGLVFPQHVQLVSILFQWYFSSKIILVLIFM